jgi:hypothetical protein
MFIDHHLNNCLRGSEGRNETGLVFGRLSSAPSNRAGGSRNHGLKTFRSSGAKHFFFTTNGHRHAFTIHDLLFTI